MRFRMVLACATMLWIGGASLRAADPVWVQVRSPNFLLFTDSSEVKGRRLLEDFEGRMSALRDAFGEIPERQFPIEVFLFNRKEDFLETAPEIKGPDGPESFTKVAYLLRGPDRIFIVAQDKSPADIADDVGHALGHVFFERSVTWRPFWLAEGAAEFFRKAGRNPDTKRVSEKDAYTVDELLEIVPSAQYEDAAPPSPFRMQAYRLSRVLIDQHPSEFRSFLRVLTTEGGKDAKPALASDVLEAEFSRYAETRQALAAAGAEVKAQQAAAVTLSIHRGDLLTAGGRPLDAAVWYKGDSREAAAARAILTRFARSGDDPVRTLARAAREHPDDGPVQLHFGSVPAKATPDIELQAAALTRAQQLLPRSGRAHAEMARVQLLLGKPELSLPELERALALEPEAADEFVMMRAEALLALARYEEAVQASRLAAALPHSGRAVNYTTKAAEMTRKVEETRRAAEDRRLQEIRSEVATQVRRTEPPPAPPPPKPAERFGRIEYSVESGSPITLGNSPLPVFANALVQRGLSGNVTVQVRVGADGKVAQAAIASSQLEEMNGAVLAAAKQWTFTPPRNARGPVAFDARIVFRFIVQ